MINKKQMPAIVVIKFVFACFFGLWLMSAVGFYIVIDLLQQILEHVQ